MIYYYTYSSRHKWAIPEKKNSGGGECDFRTYFFEKPHNFAFFYLTPGNSRQNKAPLLEIIQIFLC